MDDKNLPVTAPGIVKFAFKELVVFSVNGKLKWRATCTHCNEKITESRNTTTGFNK